MNGKRLRGQFQESNRQYFSDRLPPYRIRVVRHAPGGRVGYCRKKRRVIEILSGLSEKDIISTLLHEMAHARTPESHTGCSLEFLRVQSYQIAR